VSSTTTAISKPIGLILLFVACVCAAAGQGRRDTSLVITPKTDLDQLFRQAREQGADGDYDKSRRICQKILEYKPDYYEVRCYLGRTYAWEKQYDNARTEFARVLIEKEDNIDAICGMVDVEMWSNHSEIAGDFLRLGLAYAPADQELLVRKAKWQLKQGDQQGAASTLRKVLDIDPSNKEAAEMNKSMSGVQLNNRIQTQYSLDVFDREYRPQQSISVEYGRNNRLGSFSGRINLADRFNQRGVQIEAETYLRTTGSGYLNLLAGHSLSGVFPFPEQNYTAEYYQKLPKGMEASMGLRFLRFTDNTLIYTGSFSLYHGDYWLSLRPFITPQKTYELPDGSIGRKVSKTFFLRGRRYLSEADHYFGCRIGFGESPDDRRYFSQQEDIYLTSWQIGTEWQKRIFGRSYLKTDFNYAHEELRKDQIFHRFSLNLQVRTSF
jgi:YaiO family outer membrane protein